MCTCVEAVLRDETLQCSKMDEQRTFASLTRANIAAGDDAIYNLAWTQTEKGRRWRNVDAVGVLGCAKKQRLTLHAVTDDEGRPLDDAVNQAQDCSTLVSHFF